MSEIRCNGCYTWFDKKEDVCPFCAKPRPAYNKWLRTAALNRNLYDMAERSAKEDKAVRR